MAGEVFGRQRVRTACEPVADHEADLRLDVQLAGSGRRSAAAPCRRVCPHGRTTGVPDDDDGAGPAVVADRQVFPVGRQRVRVRAGTSGRPRWRATRWRRSRRSRPPVNGSRSRTADDRVQVRLDGGAAGRIGDVPPGAMSRTAAQSRGAGGQQRVERSGREKPAPGSSLSTRHSGRDRARIRRSARPPEPARRRPRTPRTADGRRRSRPGAPSPSPASPGTLPTATGDCCRTVDVAPVSAGPAGSGVIVAHYRTCRRRSRQAAHPVPRRRRCPAVRGADGRGGLLVGLLAAVSPGHPVGDGRRPDLGAARPGHHAEPPADAPAPAAARPVPRREPRRGNRCRHRPPAGAGQRRRADLLRRRHRAEPAVPQRDRRRMRVRRGRRRPRCRRCSAS